MNSISWRNRKGLGLGVSRVPWQRASKWITSIALKLLDFARNELARRTIQSTSQLSPEAVHALGHKMQPESKKPGISRASFDLEPSSRAFTIAIAHMRASHSLERGFSNCCSCPLGGYLQRTYAIIIVPFWINPLEYASPQTHCVSWLQLIA